MINNYVVRWKIKELDIKSNSIKVDVFKEVVNSLHKSFEFSIDIYQDNETNVSIDNFVGKTDIMFSPTDRTFNLFYTDNIKDLDIGLVYKDKINKLNLENKFLYCIPYWMPFMFESEDKAFNQQIFSIKLLTPNRPKLRALDILW